MTLEPFKMEHLDEIYPFLKDEDQKTVEAFGGHAVHRDSIEAALQKSVMLSFITDAGEVVAVIGATQRWPGSALCWSVMTTKIEKYPIGFLKASVRGLDGIHDILGLTRFDATVREDNPISQRWVEWLGFEKEGVMEKYGPEGETHFLYAKVWQ
jgi:hypothetical protein